MNDIKKLQQVIDSLEEQAAHVSEFHGVLNAVNEAKTQIEASITEIQALSAEHKKFVSGSCDQFVDFGNRLSNLEKKLVDLGQSHDKAINIISALKFLTPDQFEYGRDKILLKLSELKFLTPEQYELGRKESDNRLIENLVALNSRIDKLYTGHLSAIKSLKIMFILGILTLAGCIAFFARY